jgi:hypothetical protein
MGLLCYRRCINQVESVCLDCYYAPDDDDSRQILDTHDDLDAAWEDYKELNNSHIFHQGTDSDGNKGLFEDFEQSIGE